MICLKSMRQKNHSKFLIIELTGEKIISSSESIVHLMV